MNVMQGYCWPLSAAPGETIEFRMSTGAAKYVVTYMRFANRSKDQVTADTINASQEFNAIPMMAPFERMGRLQNTTYTSEQGCGQWATDFMLTVPKDWSSGIYAAQCVDEMNSVFYVTFIVKPAPSRRNKLAVLANTTTWNAYNNWGGYSRYEANIEDRLYQLSLLRPNPEVTPVLVDEEPFNSDIAIKVKTFPVGFAETKPMKIDETSRHLARAEMWLLNWLAEAGYVVDVYSDLDFHRGIPEITKYRALILHTHPEYWSQPMFQNLTQYLDRGGRLLYLGGNGLYECVEYPNADMSVMIIKGRDEQQPRPWLFRALAKSGTNLLAPESSLLGVQYPDALRKESRAPYQVITSTHRFFKNTGLASGSWFGEEGWNIIVGAASLGSGAASGWEIDKMTASTPAGCLLLASGTNTDYPAHMVYYEHRGGGFVFSAGSLTFGGSLVVDEKIQVIVRNVLDECLIGGNWPGLWDSNIDTTVNWGNGHVYFFKGTEYIRFNANTDSIDAAYPKQIAGNWPRLWDNQIDAAINWANGKAYFFKGGEYIRYDIAAGTADDGYPKLISGNWPGLWGGGIDAAVDWSNEIVYFFKGNEYIRYDKTKSSVSDGYPKPIVGNWPGLWDNGIDAAVNWGNGKVYFFKGSEYIRYDITTGVDEGYPKPINQI